MGIYIRQRISSRMVVHACRVQRGHETHRERGCISAWHMYAVRECCRCRDIGNIVADSTHLRAHPPGFVSVLATALHTLSFRLPRPQHFPGSTLASTIFHLLRTSVSMPQLDIPFMSLDLRVMALAASSTPRGVAVLMDSTPSLKVVASGVSLHHKFAHCTSDSLDN